MNRVLAFVTAAVIATPLLAATNPKPISAPETPTVSDSPLVAAAKKAGRLGKKPANVITNESLAKSGGHVTTTTQQTPISTPIYSSAPQQTTQTTAAPTTASSTPSYAPKPKQTEEQRQQVVKQVSQQYEGDSTDMDQDPARQEGQMKATQTPPPAPGDKKP